VGSSRRIGSREQHQPRHFPLIEGGNGIGVSRNHTRRCTTPVNCPSVLRVKAAGAVVGCKSACARFGTDQYCCRGASASRSACNPTQWPVDYAAVFKKAEPYAYSYADDDATSTFVCQGRCDYRITFGLTRPDDRPPSPPAGYGRPVRAC
jgi:hypothetical protein